jgi:hypothetical protein
VSPLAIHEPEEAASIDEARRPHRFEGEDWTNRSLPPRAAASRVSDEQLDRFRRKLTAAEKPEFDSWLEETQSGLSDNTRIDNRRSAEFKKLNVAINRGAVENPEATSETAQAPKAVSGNKIELAKLRGENPAQNISVRKIPTTPRGSGIPNQIQALSDEARKNLGLPEGKLTVEQGTRSEDEILRLIHNKLRVPGIRGKIAHLQQAGLAHKMILEIINLPKAEGGEAADLSLSQLRDIIRGLQRNFK